jgi:hypothetical protein
MSVLPECFDASLLPSLLRLLSLNFVQLSNLKSADQTKPSDTSAESNEVNAKHIIRVLLVATKTVSRRVHFCHFFFFLSSMRYDSD